MKIYWMAFLKSEFIDYNCTVHTNNPNEKMLKEVLQTKYTIAGLAFIKR